MKKRNIWIGILILTIVWVVFFYKFFLFRLHPFPADLLISTYQPWKSYSYIGYNPGSYPTKFQYFDTLRQTYPWREFAMDQIKSGSFPLWNPHNFSGHPLFANMQSAVLYPFNFVYFILDDLYAWSLLVALQPFLASVFTYLYMRKKSTGIYGSLIAAIAFGYSLFVGVFLEYNTIVHVVLWLPFLLVMVDVLIERWRFSGMVGFMVGMCSAAFAGHLQIFGLVMVFVSAYAAWRLQTNYQGKRKYNMLGRFLALMLLGLGVSSIQLIPAVELLLHSARIPHAPETMIANLLIQPWQLALFLIPDLFGNPATATYLLADTYPGNAMYIGIGSFLLALLSLVRIRKHSSTVFFAMSSLVLLLLVVRSPFTSIMFTTIPLVSASSPGNMLFLLSFCLSVLSGYGMDVWMSSKNISRKNIAGILILLSGMIGVSLMGPSEVHIRSVVARSAILMVCAVILVIGKHSFVKRSWKGNIAAMILVVLVVDLFYLFHKFNSFVPGEIVYPDAPVMSYLLQKDDIQRFWGYGASGIEANFATQQRLYSPDGYDPLYPKQYGQLISASEQGKLLDTFDHTNRSDAAIAPGAGELDLMQNHFRLRILDILGTSYVLDRQENASTQNTYPPERFEPLFADTGWSIYENKMAVPRAQLVSRVAVANTKEEFETIFFDESYDLRESVILSQDPGNIADCPSKPSVEIKKYLPNSMQMTSSAVCPTVLVVSDTYMPGWKAEIDGKETPILRANWAFRAVVVPEGEHTVYFSYMPSSFSYGWKIAIISSIFLFAWCLVERLVQSKNESENKKRT